MALTDHPDQITVGNIEQSQGIAIGTGAIAIVGYTAEQVNALLRQIGTTFQPKPFDGRSPYVGLAAFQEADADRFFGRENLLEELISRVDALQSRAIFIASPFRNSVKGASNQNAAIRIDRVAMVPFTPCENLSSKFLPIRQAQRRTYEKQTRHLHDPHGRHRRGGLFHPRTAPHCRFHGS